MPVDDYGQPYAHAAPVVSAGLMVGAPGVFADAKATFGWRGLPHAAVRAGAVAATQDNTTQSLPPGAFGGHLGATVGWYIPVASTWVIGPVAS